MYEEFWSLNLKGKHHMESWDVDGGYCCPWWRGVLLCWCCHLVTAFLFRIFCVFVSNVFPYFPSTEKWRELVWNKRKFVSVHAMKALGGGIGLAPIIRNLATSLMPVVSFTTLPLYPANRESNCNSLIAQSVAETLNWLNYSICSKSF